MKVSFILIIFSAIISSSCNTLDNASVAMFHPKGPLSLRESRTEIPEKLKVSISSNQGSIIGRGIYDGYGGYNIYNEPVIIDPSPKQIISDRFSEFASKNPDMAILISSCNVKEFSGSYSFNGITFVGRARIRLFIELNNGTEFVVFSEKKDASLGANTVIPSPIWNERKVTNSLEEALTDCFLQIAENIESEKPKQKSI